MDDERRATVRLSDDLLRRAKHAATDAGVSLQRYLLDAIREKVEREEKKG